MGSDCTLVVLVCVMAVVNIVTTNRWPMVATAEYWSPADGADIGSVLSTSFVQHQHQQPVELRLHRQRHHRYQQQNNDFEPTMLADGIDNEDITTSQPIKHKKPHKKNLIRKGQRQKNNKNGNLHFQNNSDNFLVFEIIISPDILHHHLSVAVSFPIASHCFPRDAACFLYCSYLSHGCSCNYTSPCLFV